MEDVLDVYTRPYDPLRPQVCLDETSKQLVAETRTPLPSAPGRPARFDYEYDRRGVSAVFMLCEPLRGWREVSVSDHRGMVDFAHVIKHLVDEVNPDAEQIVLVMDQLNTHSPGSLYEAFEPAEAKRLADKLEIHYTPKHGSWLNVAEIEASRVGRECPGTRRIGELALVVRRRLAPQLGKTSGRDGIAKVLVRDTREVLVIPDLVLDGRQDFENLAGQRRAIPAHELDFRAALCDTGRCDAIQGQRRERSRGFAFNPGRGVPEHCDEQACQSIRLLLPSDLEKLDVTADPELIDLRYRYRRVARSQRVMT